MNAYHHRQIEIAEILARYGLSNLAELFESKALASLEHGLSKREPRPRLDTTPRDLRLMLQELGPTFIKLGQFLSTRADLLAAEYQVELAKLQDSGPPVSAGVVEDIVQQELGRSATEAFATFDFEPIAAASIGQAHAATRHDGTEVVVKIRRPGAAEEVKQDLEILQNLAARAGRRYEAAARWDVVGLADEFARTLRAEVDYLTEARNAERFAGNFVGDPDVQIPRVYHRDDDVESHHAGAGPGDEDH